MYQYLKIERIATPCCLIPNTSYFLKIKNKNKSINKRRDCKVILLVGISYLLATHCCVMELDSQGGHSNTGIKARTSLPGSVGRTLGAAGTAEGIWHHQKGLGSWLFLLLSLVGCMWQELGVTYMVPMAIPCPSTSCSNACVLWDRKETEPGN